MPLFIRWRTPDLPLVAAILCHPISLCTSKDYHLTSHHQFTTYRLQERCIAETAQYPVVKDPNIIIKYDTTDGILWCSGLRPTAFKSSSFPHCRCRSCRKLPFSHDFMDLCSNDERPYVANTSNSTTDTTYKPDSTHPAPLVTVIST